MLPHIKYKIKRQCGVNNRLLNLIFINFKLANLRCCTVLKTYDSDSTLVDLNLGPDIYVLSGFWLGIVMHFD